MKKEYLSVKVVAMLLLLPLLFQSDGIFYDWKLSTMYSVPLFCISLYSLIHSYKNKRTMFCWLFGISTFIFNPILRIDDISRDNWSAIAVGLEILFASSIIFTHRSDVKNALPAKFKDFINTGMGNKPKDNSEDKK